MKKVKLLGVVAVIILAAAALLFFRRGDLDPFLPYSVRRPAEIPVLSEYALCYGDSPGAASGKLGLALGEKEDTEGDTSVYACPAVVLGKPAELLLYFYRDRSLSLVDITIPADSPEAADALRAQAEARIQEAYRTYGNFIPGRVRETGDGTRQSLALDYGEQGVFYTLQAFPDRLSILCEDLR